MGWSPHLMVSVFALTFALEKKHLASLNGNERTRKGWVFGSTRGVNAEYWIISIRNTLRNREVDLIKSRADQRADCLSPQFGNPAAQRGGHKIPALRGRSGDESASRWHAKAGAIQRNCLARLGRGAGSPPLQYIPDAARRECVGYRLGLAVFRSFAVSRNARRSTM